MIRQQRVEHAGEQRRPGGKAQLPAGVQRGQRGQRVRQQVEEIVEQGRVAGQQPEQLEAQTRQRIGGGKFVQVHRAGGTQRRVVQIPAVLHERLGEHLMQRRVAAVAQRGAPVQPPEVFGERDDEQRQRGRGPVRCQGAQAGQVPPPGFCGCGRRGAQRCAARDGRQRGQRIDHREIISISAAQRLLKQGRDGSPSGPILSGGTSPYLAASFPRADKMGPLGEPSLPYRHEAAMRRHAAAIPRRPPFG